MSLHQISCDQRFSARLIRCQSESKIKSGRFGFAIVLALLVMSLQSRFCQASQLRVEPVLLEIVAPSAAATLTLRNDDSVEISAQTRVFRWIQSNGKETLEPADGVVASPPTLTLKPNTDNIVRIVRTDRRPIQGQENYRVVVDEIPKQTSRNARTINLLVRQSIPVFFRSSPHKAAAVSWSLTYQDSKLVLTARNDGDEHLRLASVNLKAASGTSVSFGNGLLGYVLGRSTMSWPVPLHQRRFNASEAVTVSAMGNKGAVHAVASAPNGR